MNKWIYLGTAALAIAFSLIVAGVAFGASTQEIWQVDSFSEGANTRNFTAVHTYNPQIVTEGQTFTVNAAAWSDAEITPIGGSVVHLRMDDPVGSSQLSDENGNFPADIVGNITLQAEGRVARGIHLDGADDDDYAFIPDDDALEPSDFSALIWFNLDPNQPQSFPRLFDKFTNIGISGYRMYVQTSTDQLVAQAGFGTGSTTLSTPITRGQWTHGAMTYNSDTNQLKLYVDGSLVSSTVLALDPLGNSESLKFGNSAALDEELKGYLDDFYFYNKTLTQEEINAHFFRGLDTFPFITTLDTEGCSVVSSNETTGGQYQHSRVWTIEATSDSCTWVGNLQYFDPGFSNDAAVDLYFSGSVQTSPSGHAKWASIVQYVEVGLLFLLGAYALHQRWTLPTLAATLGILGTLAAISFSFTASLLLYVLTVWIHGFIEQRTAQAI